MLAVTVQCVVLRVGCVNPGKSFVLSSMLLSFLFCFYKVILIKTMEIFMTLDCYLGLLMVFTKPYLF